MSVIQGNSTSGSGYSIANSLRLRSSASAYLSRTPASAGNRTTWTWAGWVKRGTVTSAAAQRLFAVDSSPSGEPSGVWISSTDTVNVVFADDSGTNNRGTAFTGALRDPSAWYHLVVACDTSQALDVNKIKLFVNGSQFSGSAYGTGYPTLSMQGHINMSRLHTIGQFAGIQFFDGYLSDVYFIDGQALDPNDFGYVNADTGQWVPKKYTGAYGTNGFYLPFNDGTNLTNLCLDRSGNGNNWTANNFSLTSDVTYDWMDDTPTNNYAVLSPLDKGSDTTLTEGNLLSSTSVSEVFGANATIGISSGKFYWEILSGSGLGVSMLGIRNASASRTIYVGGDSNGYAYYQNGVKYTNNVGTSYGASWTTNDVIGVAFDCDSGSITFYKNNVSQGVAFTGIPANTWFPAISDGSSVTQSADYINFGQRPFAYAPPTGFKSLCTKNMPAPVIANPKRHFEAVTWTSTGTTQSITGAQFQPDMLWSKQRNGTAGNVINNSVIGASQYLTTHSTGAETTATAFVTSFDSGGMTFGTGQYTGGAAVVGWLWKANGAPVANNAGSIQSQVSANTTAGFSIVTYTGTGANATVGHGLGVAPKMVIVKARVATTTSDAWNVGHSSLTGGFGDFLELNSTGASVTDANRWNSTNPTSLVFSIGPVLSDSAKSFVAYCFAEVPGFSKIGSYIGNGSSDGPFVYCGFRPRFVMVKCSSAAGGGWVIHDSARSPKNIADQRLSANISDAEYGSDGFGIDILSNGFKARTADGNWNSSGQTYIFYAVAEYPFNYSTAR